MYILSKSYGKTDTQLFIQQQVGVRKMSALASNLRVQLLSVHLLPSGAHSPAHTVCPGHPPPDGPPWLRSLYHCPQSATGPAALPQGLLRDLNPGPRGQWGWAGYMVPGRHLSWITGLLQCASSMGPTQCHLLYDVLGGLFLSETSAPGIKAILREPQRQEKESEKR